MNWNGTWSGTREWEQEQEEERHTIHDPTVRYPPFKSDRVHDDTDYMVLPGPRRGQPERRSAGRVGCDGLRRSLGEIVDLSPAGMRVRRKGRRTVSSGQELTVAIGYMDFDLSLAVRVVWVQKAGFRRWIYGLEILNPDEGTRTRLLALVRNASERLIIG